MRVLVTGFGPFPGVARNPSQFVVETLPGRIGGAEVHSCVLRTEYRTAGRVIEDLLATLRPDVCICTGVGAGASFKLETTAHNHGGAAAPDQAGFVHRGPVEIEGPFTYCSTLPLEEIRASLAARDYPIELSHDAGGYVCNHVFYRARHAIEHIGLPTLCGFFHLPSVEAVAHDAQIIARCRDAVCGVVQVTLVRSSPAAIR
jgi:pyroglutamyl-peptidase